METKHEWAVDATGGHADSNTFARINELVRINMGLVAACDDLAERVRVLEAAPFKEAFIKQSILIKSLRSIANSTCCGRCNEAKLVARKALSDSGVGLA